MKIKIKVILVDDHAVVRARFRMLLSTEDTIEVIAEAKRGEQACQLYLEKQPDVMVLNLFPARHRWTGKHTAYLQS